MRYPKFENSRMYVPAKLLITINLPNCIAAKLNATIVHSRSDESLEFYSLGILTTFYQRPTAISDVVIYLPIMILLLILPRCEIIRGDNI